MFAKLFGICKGDSPSSSDQLKLALDALGKKELVLQKKISIEMGRAKEFAKAKNKQAAMQCLKRKRYYEGQMEHLGSFQMKIHDQEKKHALVQCKQVQQIANEKNNLVKS